VDPIQRETLVSRIISGRTPIRLRGRRYLVAPPGRRDRAYGHEVYREELEKGLQEGLWDEEGLKLFLVQRGLWTESDEKALGAAPRDVETLKVNLFEARFRSEERAKVRKALGKVRSELGRLLAKRHSHDDKGAEYHATLMRVRYWVGCGLRTWSGKRVFRHEGFWQDTDGLLDEAVGAVALARPDDSELRDLARTDPWRGLWNARRAEASLFGVPAVDLTDEQRGLVSWSLLYDGARECPDCPPDDVFNDDDEFDGWLIKRKREGGKESADELIKNEKIRNSQSVFVVADTMEDAKRVDRLNDPAARQMKRDRLNLIRSKGEVSELEMPDTRVRLQTMVAEKAPR
jgi:hypothetical protein